MTFSGLVSEVIQVSLIQIQDMFCYRGQTTLLWQCGRRTASAGLPGLRMLHLIDEQQLETLAERRDGGEVLAGGT